MMVFVFMISSSGVGNFRENIRSHVTNKIVSRIENILCHYIDLLFTVNLIGLYFPSRRFTTVGAIQRIKVNGEKCDDYITLSS